jgi:hypothetical protein
VGRLMRSVIFTLACALMVVALGATPSEARGLKKISSISRVGQDWAHARLKVSWRGAKGVTYQWRYADSPSALLRTKAVWSGTSRGTYTRALDRGKVWYFQVRAFKKGVVGPWSRTRQLRFLNRWPNTPVVSTTRLAGAVQWNWGTAANASRYRVRWSPAWYGSWPGDATYTPDGWVGQSAHSSKFTLPTTPQPGDGMLAVAYANPVFGQVQAQNQYITNGTGIHQSNWFPIWAKAPAPAPGDAVRFGTYNVMLNPSTTRAAAASRNIAAHGLTMVALQEANASSATAFVRNLGSAWRSVPTSSTSQQILYRADLYNLLSQGTYNVDSPRDPSNPVVTPWARFSAKNPVSQDSQSFYVSSVHFTEDASKSAVDKNADTGHNARQAMNALNSIDYAGEPLIVAGDMRYGREPWGDVAGYVPAQPTFIRGGFYDAMASQSMSGNTYSTVNSVNGNPTAKQVPNPAGLGPRSDYILMKGIVGSKAYTNVANYSYNGTVPSDHNLVYSDILIPTR